MTIAAAAAPVGADPAKGHQMFEGRLERSYEIPASEADGIEALIAEHLPKDKFYPTPQTLDTTFVRTTEGKFKHGEWKPEKDLKADKFRVRTYTDTPGQPTFLEFKAKSLVDGVEVETKQRIPVATDTVAQLLAGRSASEVLDVAHRPDAERAIAERAAHIVDDLGIKPVIHETYLRAAYENAEGTVRMTVDRGITQTGIGELAKGGTVHRGNAIFDIKVVGETPEWVNSLIDAKSGVMHLVEDGKGATSLGQLMENVIKHH
jgi:hypothetical protein